MTDNGYHRWIHRFGISSSLLLFVAMTAFPVAISFVYGIWPDFKALWPGFVAVILFMAPYWPAETIGYMSVMGPGALYMSYITGNVTNLRMPATIGTINSLGIKPNTEECHTMAIIACGASVITTVVIVALGVVIATPLAPVLEGKKQFLYFLVPLAICLFFCYFTAVNSAYYMLIAIAVSVIIYVMDYKKEKQKEVK